MRFGIDINRDTSLSTMASNRLDDKISILRRSRSFLFATSWPCSFHSNGYSDISPRRQSGRSVMLDTYLHLILRTRMPILLYVFNGLCLSTERNLTLPFFFCYVMWG